MGNSLDSTLPPHQAGSSCAQAGGPPRRKLSRRELIHRAGKTMLGGAGLLTAAAGARLLFPRVHHTPPTTVVLGKPGEFAVSEVCERFKDTHRLVLIRQELGFYALRAVCTKGVHGGYHRGRITNQKPLRPGLRWRPWQWRARRRRRTHERHG